MSDASMPALILFGNEASGEGSEGTEGLSIAA